MAGNKSLIHQYQQIHSTNAYGNTSIKNLRFMRPEIAIKKPASILDYGCGQSRLVDYLVPAGGVKTYRYDPAIAEVATLPTDKVDLLVNVDVLEHIEEADLDSVLAEMRGLCRDALIIVDLKEAQLVLEDGRNAHVTLKPRKWWRDRISAHFGPLYEVKTARSSRAGFRTWKRSPAQEVRFRLLRVWETLKYYALRLVGIREGR